MDPLKFFVSGVPVPKGSGRPVPVKRKDGSVGTRVIQDNAERQKPWASAIGYTARQHYGGALLQGPVKLTIRFFLPRPKSHYGTGKKAGVLRVDAPDFHTNKPDYDKLVRCVKDALTGVIWLDDSQVCLMGESGKFYGEIPGAHISIEAL